MVLQRLVVWAIVANKTLHLFFSTMNPVPIPNNYRNALDRFIGIAFDAPEFKNSPLKVPFTLEDAIESLDMGVVGVASRVKNTEAQALFEKCRAQIKVAHQLYKENKIDEARVQILVAQGSFKEAAKLRNGTSNKKGYDLVEDEGQP